MSETFLHYSVQPDEEKETKTKQSKFIKMLGAKKSPKEEKKEDTAAGYESDGSTDSKKGFSLFGKSKKPRAEYQAEIDELKLKLAAATSDLEVCKQKLDAWEGWAKRAPKYEI